MKRIIGITGGIASGKSNVCSVIANMGYPIIDCDKINKELSKVGMPIYNAIVEAFGSAYLLDNKEINRKKLARLIFNDNEAKQLLNSISHPLIMLEIQKQINEINDGLIFVEIPLLYEVKFDTICDKVICVYLNKELQIQRLMNRENIDRAYALAKINSQMDLERKKELADYIIDSKGDFSDTRYQIENIIKKIKGE